MDTYEAIYSRKTIRDFAPTPVAPETMQRIIAAGFAAPSNNHMREWHFVLLNDPERRKQLLDQVIHPVGAKGALGIINRWQMTDADQREMYLDAIPKQYSMLFTSACLLLPFYKQPCPLLKPKTLSDLNAFASIWLCIENMLLAAAAEGIYGVVRIPGEEERRTIKEFVHAPEGFETPCYVALGYPAENAKRAGQVEINLNERIHANGW